MARRARLPAATARRRSLSPRGTLLLPRRRRMPRGRRTPRPRRGSWLGSRGPRKSLTVKRNVTRSAIPAATWPPPRGNDDLECAPARRNLSAPPATRSAATVTPPAPSLDVADVCTLVLVSMERECVNHATTRKPWRRQRSSSPAPSARSLSPVYFRSMRSIARSASGTLTAAARGVDVEGARNRLAWNTSRTRRTPRCGR